MSYSPVTLNNHPLSEARSALQKEIRRGNEREAVFWAAEMEHGYVNYLWRTLLVIAHEDVGLASPETVTFVEMCRQHYMAFYEDGRWENMMLINAVAALCRAPKTRLAISLHLLTYESPVNMPVPDYALDMHTQRGRNLGRGIEHFHEEGVKLHPKDPAADPWEEEALQVGKTSKLLPAWVAFAEKVKSRKKSKPSGRPQAASLFDDM